jgi:hypothetical protein
MGKPQFNKIIKDLKQKPKRLPMRYTDNELATIRSLFKESEEVLLAIRKVFLQGMLDERQQGIVKNLSAEALRIIKKNLIPDIDPDSPFFQLATPYKRLITTPFNIRERLPDMAIAYLKAKDLEIEYLNQQFKVLCGEDVEQKIVLTDLIKPYIETENARSLKDDETRYTEFMAYMGLIDSDIDSLLFELKVLALREEGESPEEAAKKLFLNSNE